MTLGTWWYITRYLAREECGDHQVGDGEDKAHAARDQVGHPQEDGASSQPRGGGQHDGLREEDRIKLDGLREDCRGGYDSACSEVAAASQGMSKISNPSTVLAWIPPSHTFYPHRL